MIENMNQILEESRSKLAEIEKKKRQLFDLENSYDLLLEKKRVAYDVLKKETKDVDKIVGISIASFVASILNNRDEKIEKEEVEAIEAKRAYDTIAYEFSCVESEIATVKNIIKNESEIRRLYEQTLEAKKQYFIKTSPELKIFIEEEESKLNAIELQLKEVNEALEAAKIVNSSIDLALAELNQAKNLGVFDMLGGGLLVTLAKRTHMDAAQTLINQMNKDLKNFERELKDVSKEAVIQVELGKFLSIGDYLFDGFFIDLFVQNKINEVLSQIKTADEKVSDLYKTLEVLSMEYSAEKERIKKEIALRIDPIS